MSLTGIVYEPVGMVVGALGGVLAGALFEMDKSCSGTVYSSRASFWDRALSRETTSLPGHR
ncbi:hypothetical protein [Kitasatospora sp. NPDC085879]|uniref:hypothetical protein n=1 Tax=Kitasatospora sp. NPDC085879 TaxID=3154769 RepID=UPI0015C8A870|nr:hypothetical protein [Streptomyces sp. TLI_235]